MDINLSGPEFTRLANNFYNSQGLDSFQQRINMDALLVNYFLQNLETVKKRQKVAFIWVCLNPPYWQFAKAMIEGARNYFLPGHDVDYLLWSDMPETKEDVRKRIMDHVHPVISAIQSIDEYKKGLAEVEQVADDVSKIRQIPGVTVFPTEPIEWPMPTLMRYHTFLQQEELLATYDYVFYCDVDMMFVDIVGDEILGDGLTASVNPMYYFDKSMFPPYEPNPASTAYIPRPGRVLEDNKQKRFQPLYYAGGFQGGKTDKFIEAMKVMRKNIDRDFANNYIAIWNEESHWNKYLFENPPAIVLNPSYIYPDSLHKEYYEPRWGRAYQPKLVTLTKKFSLRPLSPQEQEQITAMKPK